MAIRRPEASARGAPERDPGRTEWPYPVTSGKLLVRSDGSVRLPAQMVAMLAAPGDELVVTVFSDGHIEIETTRGRRPLPPRTPGSRVYGSDEEFLAALEEWDPGL